MYASAKTGIASLDEDGAGVDADDDGEPELERLSEHEFGLRHGALKRVDDKNTFVYASAKTGIASLDEDGAGVDMTPLFETILDYIPAPDAAWRPQTRRRQE